MRARVLAGVLLLSASLVPVLVPTPARLVLTLPGALLLSGPLRAAWRRDRWHVALLLALLLVPLPGVAKACTDARLPGVHDEQGCAPTGRAWVPLGLLLLGGADSIAGGGFAGRAHDADAWVPLPMAGWLATAMGLAWPRPGARGSRP